LPSPVHVERRLRHRTVNAAGRPLDVAVATLGLRADRFRMALVAPVRVTDLTRGATAAVPGFRSKVVTALAKEEASMDALDKLGTIIGSAARAEEIAGAFANVAEGKGAVGAVTTAGERSMVPLTETLFAGGYGGGGGVAAETADTGVGGGAGGFARSRTVAVVEVAPDGVTVRPVVDKTAVALAGIAAALGLVSTLMRARRR
jgi:uncharacterized spore protein YtfJ